jgi:hypothetical protein
MTRMVLALNMLLVVFLSGIVPANAQGTDVNCGDEIRAEISVDERRTGHSYRIPGMPGDRLRIRVTPATSAFAAVSTVDDPAGTRMILRRGGEGEVVEYEVELPATGEYRILVNGSRARYIGEYYLEIDCILANSPSPNPPPPPSTDGFLFPNLPEDGIELSFVQGQAQTIPVGNDIVLGMYAVANTDQSATLSISRISGDISLGVTVVNRDTGEIIFLSGMPSSNHLSVELTFPTGGNYAIGLFRLDTAERNGTSGTVQILIE